MRGNIIRLCRCQMIDHEHFSKTFRRDKQPAIGFNAGRNAVPVAIGPAMGAPYRLEIVIKAKKQAI